MAMGMNLAQHINTFNQVVNDTLRIDIKFDDEDKAMILLIFLPAFPMNTWLQPYVGGKRIWILKNPNRPLQLETEIQVRVLGKGSW